MPPLRTTSPTASAARSSGRTSRNTPLWRPTGVRTAPTITASGIFDLRAGRPLHSVWGFGLRGRAGDAGRGSSSFADPTGRAIAFRGIPLLRDMAGRDDVGCRPPAFRRPRPAAKLYPPGSVRLGRATRGTSLWRLRQRCAPHRLPPVHGGREDGPLRHGPLFVPLLLLSGLRREDVHGRRVRGREAGPPGRGRPG